MFQLHFFFMTNGLKFKTNETRIDNVAVLHTTSPRAFQRRNHAREKNLRKSVKMSNPVD